MRSTPTGAQLAHWPEVPVPFVIMLALVGIGEEAGWTAFAAPQMLRNHGILGGWVVLSAMRIVWHLPMMLSGDLSWVTGVVGNAAFTMLAIQVFTLSGGAGRWWRSVDEQLRDGGQVPGRAPPLGSEGGRAASQLGQPDEGGVGEHSAV